MRIVHHLVVAEQEDIGAVRLAQLSHPAQHARDGRVQLCRGSPHQLVQERDHKGFLLHAMTLLPGAVTHGLRSFDWDKNIPLSTVGDGARPIDQTQ